MNPTTSGLDQSDLKKRQKDAAAEIARKKVLAAYYSDGHQDMNHTMSHTISHTFPSQNEETENKEDVTNEKIITQPTTPQTTVNGQSQKTNVDFSKLFTSRTRNKAFSNLGRVAQRMISSPTRPAPTAFKDTPINAKTAVKKTALDGEAIDWQKYHSAWQLYYQKYYSDYYAKAANQYLEEERDKIKTKTQEIITDQPVNPSDEDEKNIFQTLKQTIQKHAAKEAGRSRRYNKFIPIIAGGFAVLLVLFLQYNRLIFAPLMAYVAPGNVTDDGITAVDPTVTKAIGPDSRLMIPKLNVDVPVHFGISNDEDTVNAAMENGVAQFAIPGASAMPGQIGNLVITGHSAGDIYSNNQYKFIFSGLERLGNNDLIYIDYNEMRYTYSVTKMETVEPTNVAALIYETDKPVLTLITCTPLGTSRYRLLVTAEQINPTPTNATPQQQLPAVDDNSHVTENNMPQNEATFFEKIWRWLTGKN